MAQTASVHVSHILGKLRLSNRVEAAVVVQQMGLLIHSPELAPSRPSARRTDPPDPAR